MTGDYVLHKADCPALLGLACYCEGDMDHDHACICFGAAVLARLVEAAIDTLNNNSCSCAGCPRCVLAIRELRIALQPFRKRGDAT